MHRLFFAVVPDAAARQALRARVDALDAGAPGPWVDARRWHLTLAFLGKWDARPADLAERAVTAATAVQAPAFALRLDRLDSFAGRRPPWFLAPSTVPDALDDLVRQLHAQLAAAGVDFDRRPFAPHLTVRYGATRAPAQAVPAVEWTVHDFALWLSTSGAAAHERVAAFPLA